MPKNNNPNIYMQKSNFKCSKHINFQSHLLRRKHNTYIDTAKKCQFIHMIVTIVCIIIIMNSQQRSHMRVTVVKIVVRIISDVFQVILVPVY